ncbi:type I restriction enzyme HsdR N-terminal domain-containing protein [Candidatus Nomurabacteria bacterium]|nr:type I restriction enzyme HsdR N-terminal domain-containing protein [Candidatus Nomurabacteria bacterium]
MDELMNDLSEALRNKVAESLALATSSGKINEACTCDWIIRPLLHEAGYKLNEILPQAVDQNKQYPDYKILPETEHSWFLEAKAWSEKLTDSHVNQGLIYAFTNNRRWVVLTNGHEWRLYDNHIQGELHTKLVTSVVLEDTEEAISFFQAIGPESIKGDGISKYSNQARLRRILEVDLKNPESELIKSIQKAVKKSYGLTDVSCLDLCKILNGREIQTLVTVSPIITSVPVSDVKVKPASSRNYSLTQLRPGGFKTTTGKKPVEVVTPDGISYVVHTWVDFAIRVITYLIERDQLPQLPYAAGSTNNFYFLNTKPEHPGLTAESKFVPVSVNGVSVYVDIHRSARNFCRQIYQLCLDTGIDPGKVFLRFAE